MNKYKISRIIHPSGPDWWSVRCNNLEKKILLRKAIRLVSMNFLTRYKRVEAKIRHDIRDSMHHFWYSACKIVNSPYILFEFFEKFKNRSCSFPFAHFSLSQNVSLISNAVSQADIFADYSS